jgi:protein involved in polysaccharide export with SLBB domain
MKKLLFTLLYLFPVLVFGQNGDIQIGSSLNQLRQSQGALYDYSDPESVNIKVAIWGFVKFPGKYIIPINSTVNDLLSLSGGPTDDAHLNELKLIRIAEDSSQVVVDLSYEDVMWDKEVKVFSRNRQITAGDILVVPGEQRLYFRDYLTISLSVVSTLISLSILILNIVK